MMVFTSIYGVVDGLFVSNYVGKTAFAAINLVMPFIMIFGGIGFMFGTGGSALVAKTLGLKDSENANRYFTMMSLVTLVVGIIISIVGMIFMRPIAIFLGAENNRTLCDIRTHYNWVQHGIYASESLSEFSYHGRKTQTRSLGHRCSRCYQYGA
jgi:Na+-driven multidrug efflux pump